MLPEKNSAGYNAAQIMMTLSAIGYADPSLISGELSNPHYATNGEWVVAWGPVYNIDSVYTDNLMFVAQLKNQNLYAVVIRGTVLTYDLSTLIDIYEDLEVSVAYPWNYPNVPGALVASGTLLGLDILTNMQDSTTGQTLLSFFQSVPAAFIYVVGHSLGGCLTTVLAPWLKYQFKTNNVNQGFVFPYTFAAPTAGNVEFAEWYDQEFGNSARYYNDIDVIPMGWADLSVIKTLFPSGPTCPWTMKAVVDLVIDWLWACGVSYTQTNGTGTSLNRESSQNSDWLTEMGNQHYHNTYLSLLQAPPVQDNPPVNLKRQTRHHEMLLMPEKPVALIPSEVTYG